MSDHKFDRLLSEIRNANVEDSVVDQAGERDARRVNGSHGVGGDARGEWMRGVHHGADALSLDPGGEPFPASETADPVGDGRRGRGSGPPRER